MRWRRGVTKPRRTTKPPGPDRTPPIPISTSARRRSTPGRTRSSATSSPKPCLASEFSIMFANLTEEQRLLQESLERFRQLDYTFEKRRAHLAKLGAQDDPAWTMLAEMGWLAATLPEEHGGLG